MYSAAIRRPSSRICLVSSSGVPATGNGTAVSIQNVEMRSFSSLPWGPGPLPACTALALPYLAPEHRDPPVGRPQVLQSVNCDGALADLGLVVAGLQLLLAKDVRLRKLGG